MRLEFTAGMIIVDNNDIDGVLYVYGTSDTIDGKLAALAVAILVIDDTEYLVVLGVKEWNVNGALILTVEE